MLRGGARIGVLIINTVNSRYKDQLGGMILILIASVIPKARVPKGTMK